MKITLNYSNMSIGITYRGHILELSQWSKLPVDIRDDNISMYFTTLSTIKWSVFNAWIFKKMSSLRKYNFSVNSQSDKHPTSCRMNQSQNGTFFVDIRDGTFKSYLRKNSIL